MHGWVKANLNPESETTLRDDLPPQKNSLDNPKNVFFWAFPERKHSFLGEVIPNKIPYAKIKKTLKVGLHFPKHKKEIKAPFL